MMLIHIGRDLESMHAKNFTASQKLNKYRLDNQHGCIDVNNLTARPNQRRKHGQANDHNKGNMQTTLIPPTQKHQSNENSNNLANCATFWHNHVKRP